MLLTCLVSNRHNYLTSYGGCPYRQTVRKRANDSTSSSRPDSVSASKVVEGIGNGESSGEILFVVKFML